MENPPFIDDFPNWNLHLVRGFSIAGLDYLGVPYGNLT